MLTLILKDEGPCVSAISDGQTLHGWYNRQQQVLSCSQTIQMIIWKCWWKCCHCTYTYQGEGGCMWNRSASSSIASTSSIERTAESQNQRHSPDAFADKNCKEPSESLVLGKIMCLPRRQLSKSMGKLYRIVIYLLTSNPYSQQMKTCSSVALADPFWYSHCIFR